MTFLSSPNFTPKSHQILAMTFFCLDLNLRQKSHQIPMMIFFWSSSKLPLQFTSNLSQSFYTGLCNGFHKNKNKKKHHVVIENITVVVNTFYNNIRDTSFCDDEMLLKFFIDTISKSYVKWLTEN